MTETVMTQGLRFLSYAALAAFLLSGSGCTAEQARHAHLQPPPGYFAKVADAHGKARACPEVPEPYTGDLFFPSKYSGSDAARDKLNARAAARYRSMTANVRTLEDGLNKQVAHYLSKGRPADLACAMQWLTTWAQADALLSKQYNHTGKSVRKWALGSIAGAYLRLKFSVSQPLGAYEPEAEQIERWIARLADQVVLDWNAQPLDRRNNHQYWAAWSVMASAVILNRRDLFDWSIEQYRHAMQQVDAEGYLPLELSRQTRALAYHNYSLGPLLMIAAFARANQLDLSAEQPDPMPKLVGQVVAGLQDPTLFQEKTGYPQTLEDLNDSSKLAWLEPYCALYPCSKNMDAWRRSLQPLSTYRLGGNMTQLFSGQLP